MTEAVEQLKFKAGALTTLERADLAYFPLSSLKPLEEGNDDSWRVEIARRIEEIRDGQAVGRPMDEVLLELRERLA